MYKTDNSVDRDEKTNNMPSNVVFPSKLSQKNDRIFMHTEEEIQEGRYDMEGIM